MQLHQIQMSDKPAVFKMNPLFVIYFNFSKGWQNTYEMQMKVLFLSLTLEQTTPSLFSGNGVLTDLFPIKKAVFCVKKREGSAGHMTASVISCRRSVSATRPCLPATAQRRCSRRTHGKGKKHSLRTEGLRHIEKPCSVSSTTHLKSTHTYLFILVSAALFIFGNKNKEIC